MEFSGHVEDEAMIVAGDNHAHRFKQLAHERDVRNIGHVCQHVTAFGPEAGGHELEHAVLGPADADFSV